MFFIVILVFPMILLTRTAFLFIKAASLWSDNSQFYGEDACANLYFALEGCLRHISVKHLSQQSYVYKSTKEYIVKNLSTLENIIDNLDYSHELRTQIVHPDAMAKLGWFPELFADDFYEYFGLANELFYFAVTKTSLHKNHLHCMLY